MADLNYERMLRGLAEVSITTDIPLNYPPLRIVGRAQTELAQHLLDTGKVTMDEVRRFGDELMSREERIDFLNRTS